MELRVLRYFVEIAIYSNFTLAAASLQITQPTLSKQIQELEEELGVRLFERGKRKTVLTEEGNYFLKKAREILELAERAKLGVKTSNMTGEVYIAGGETRAMRLVAKAMKLTQIAHPGIKFHIYSGNEEAVSVRLEKGLADFGAFVQPANLEKFDYINMPQRDTWGVLLRKDHELASHTCILASDLAALPVICSSQSMVNNEIAGWMGNYSSQLNITGTYNLLYNAAIMVREGMGAALCLDGIADISSSSDLCFRPLEPLLQVNISIAWKKEPFFSPAARAFHKILCQETRKPC